MLARGGLTRRQIFRPRQVCFNSQQAAEKAIKALLVVEEVEFLFVHDLERLVRPLQENMTMAANVSDLGWLGQWATETRYPGSVEPEWTDARRSVEIAQTIVADARTNLDHA